MVKDRCRVGCSTGPVFDPGSCAGINLNAIALEQQGKSEAAQVWRAVTARNPTDAAAFASLGVVLSKQQKYPEAATSL